MYFFRLKRQAFRSALLLPLLVVIAAASAPPDPEFSVLVFSKTAGFRHDSIPDGIEAIRKLGREHNFAVDASEDAGVFTGANLEKYDVVVFLSTTLDILDAPQEEAFKGFIRNGGGFAGIHAAADTEYEWEWYGKLVGAYFESHPRNQHADIIVVDRVHPSTAHLPARWNRFDEWYNYKANPRGNVHVLAVLDEKTYEGGKMGHDHPIAWAHEFDGGRAWYTGLGHTKESYTEPAFLQHILGGIQWAAGAVSGDVGATLNSSFEKVVLMPEVTDPMELGIAPDGRVFVAERSGPIKMWDPATNSSSMVGFIPVRMTIEDGLLGLTLDPAFDENGWIYVYYAPADGGPNRLARLTFDGSRVDPASEKILLEIPLQQEECCHSAGSLTFGPDGNLFLSTGDNSNPYPLGGSPMDERPGYSTGDAQGTSANTNDLRGKIIRIKPLPDGTYAIPEGNLFDADALHRPEIYTMGHRNPYRISVDPQTGWLYWGDVGIGNAPSEARGPWGWDEFNQAREAGFYGWPYFVGPNDAYRDYDYATGESGDFFNPEAPVNESPNNTGARELPPAQPSMIWYTYGPSEEFPELGSGGINPMAGPIYRYDAASISPQGLPSYYDGSVFLYEWMRNWIIEMKLDEDGRPLKLSPFLPGWSFTRPTDLEVGADGRLYIIEWGESFWGSNEDAQVVRLDYYGTSQRPDVAEVPAAPEPRFTVSLPREGSVYDEGRPIAFAVTGSENVVVRTFEGHDTHEHPLAETRGQKGEVRITHEWKHVPDIYYTDRYAVLEFQDESGTRRVILQPRRKEAEHVSAHKLAERKTFGKHPAEPDFPETALTVLEIGDGGYAAYEPINLSDVSALKVRVKSEKGATVEVRLDNPDGTLLAASAVEPSPASQSAKESTSMLDEALNEAPADAPIAFEGWQEIILPVDGDGTRRLYLGVSGGRAQVDWMEFAKR